MRVLPCVAVWPRRVWPRAGLSAYTRCWQTKHVGSLPSISTRSPGCRMLRHSVTRRGQKASRSPSNDRARATVRMPGFLRRTGASGGRQTPRCAPGYGDFGQRSARDRKFADSPLEGAGFEPSVPRPIFNGFEAWSELEPIDPKRGSSAEKLRPDQTIGSEGGHSGAGAHAESGGPTEGSRALGDASSEESARTGTPGVAIPRIASPEMFPEAEMLPHLICSRPILIGGANDEADQHGGA